MAIPSGAQFRFGVLLLFSDVFNLNGRCFPHVVNLAIQGALNKLTEVDPLSTFLYDIADVDNNVEEDEISTPAALIADPSYLVALLCDPVNCVRKLVSSCHASRIRRDDFHDTILSGNADGSFQQKLRPIQLLRDMEVCWSSTYLMVARALELYPVRVSITQIVLPIHHQIVLQAIKKFIKLPRYERKLDSALLTKKELLVLREIHHLLKLPHRVQELLASEKTVSLCMTQ